MDVDLSFPDLQLGNAQTLTDDDDDTNYQVMYEEPVKNHTSTSQDQNHYTEERGHRDAVACWPRSRTQNTTATFGTPIWEERKPWWVTYHLYCMTMHCPVGDSNFSNRGIRFSDEARKCVAEQVKNKRHADQDDALGIPPITILMIVTNVTKKFSRPTASSIRFADEAKI